MDHYQHVKSFFNRTAARYRERPRAFRAYYFGQRLELALERILPGQRVLDVGCGRGELYERLGHFPEVQEKYVGLDISTGMLELSQVPGQKLRLSTLERYTETILFQPADRLVALGLTTYYQAGDLPVFYAAIAKSLGSKGQAIVSYTHSESYDFRVRRFLHRTLGPFISKERSLGRAFEIYASTPASVAATLPTELRITSIHWLPAAVPLVTHCFPHLSVRLAKGLLKNWSTRWRGDFVLVIEHN